MPQLLDLPDGYIVRWNALDPATGAAVTGVVVSNVSIFGTVLGALGDVGQTYPPVLLRTRVSSG
jgi:hypothetical protein